MSESNVKPFPMMGQPSKEEIEERMKRDEAELDGYLSKFQTVSMPDSSSIEVEDEDEEEIVTLDFNEEQIIAYEKVAEGIIARDGEEIAYLEDKAITEKIKGLLEEQEAPRLQKKYSTMLEDLMVMKAIAALIRNLNEVEEGMLDVSESKRMGLLNSLIEEQTRDYIYKKKQELRSAIAGGRVHYDKIPSWAEGYIDEYIQNAISGIVELTERD